MDAYPRKNRKGLEIRRQPNGQRERLTRHTGEQINKFWLDGYDWKYICPGAASVRKAYDFVSRWPVWALENVANIVNRIRTKFISIYRHKPTKTRKTVKFVLATPYANAVMDLAMDAKRKAVDSVQRLYESIIAVAERTSSVTVQQPVGGTSGTNSDAPIYHGITNTVDSLRQAAAATVNSLTEHNIDQTIGTMVTKTTGAIATKIKTITRTTTEEDTEKEEPTVLVENNKPQFVPFEMKYETKYSRVQNATKWQDIPPFTMTLIKAYGLINNYSPYPETMIDTLGWTRQEIKHHLDDTIRDRLTFELEHDLTSDDIQALDDRIHEQGIKWPVSATTSQRGKFINMVQESFNLDSNQDTPPWLTDFSNDMINLISLRKVKRFGNGNNGTESLAAAEAQRVVDDMNDQVARVREIVGFWNVERQRELFTLQTKDIYGVKQYFVTSSFEPGKTISMTQAKLKLTLPPQSNWSNETKARYPHGVPL